MTKLKNKKLRDPNLVYSYTFSLSTSALKARRVIDVIRGRTYEDAIKILEFLPYHSSELVLRALVSAGSNAVDQKNWLKTTLVVKQAFVDQGAIMKRFRPRAQGRGFAIQKKTCHLTIGLASEK